MTYHAGDKLSVASKFHHHGSVKNLWENEWKAKCKMNIYPFNHGSFVPDFEPIFRTLIEKNVNDPYDEAWPEEFTFTIKALISQADNTMRHDIHKASSLYLRACAVCHIARYPVLSSPLRRSIWDLQTAAYLKAASVWPDPVQQVSIPHIYRTRDEEELFPFHYRYPASTARSRGPVPVVVLMSGLDGFRCDHLSKHTEFFHERGWAYVCVDIPAGGDCPADKHDPRAPDRLWSTLLDWIAVQPELDATRVAVWGYSTGAYYSLRAAHTHADALAGVVAQGLFAHRAFEEGWLSIMDVGEYHASLTKSLVFKFGYDSLEEMKADAQQRFSLVENGILDMPHAKLLLLNGGDDTIYPIEDSKLVLTYPGPKEARFFEGLPHMGEPRAGPVGFEWLVELLGDNGKVGRAGRNAIEAKM